MKTGGLNRWPVVSGQRRAKAKGEVVGGEQKHVRESGVEPPQLQSGRLPSQRRKAPKRDPSAQKAPQDDNARACVAKRRRAAPQMRPGRKKRAALQIREADSSSPLPAFGRQASRNDNFKCVGRYCGGAASMTWRTISLARSSSSGRTRTARLPESGRST